MFSELETYFKCTLLIYCVFAFAALSQVWYCQKLRTFWGKILFAENFDGVEKITFCMSGLFPLKSPLKKPLL